MCAGTGPVGAGAGGLLVPVPLVQEGLLVLVGSLERVASDEVSSEVSVPVVRSEDSAANLAVAWEDLMGALVETVVREASAASEE
ncbi:hypothetical protein C6341_g28041 [Phytophthora cactorum]|nr:hypothetical protein C6341_g28041 [Phytophthora cactorum]